MAIITFKGNGNKETGNTSAAIATATCMSIQHNMKILLMSTGLNEDTLYDSFWTTSTKKMTLPNGQTKTFSTIQSGIEGLSRMISSSKIEPRIIRDYTKVVLTGRFDVLLGFTGEEKQYIELQENYAKIIDVANQYYDMIIIDLDKRLLPENQEQIINASDIIITTINQNVKQLQYLSDNMDKDKTLVTMGRYDDSLKVNIKNVTRNILKIKKEVNTIPYNSKFFEAMQEGTAIDLFLGLMKIKNKKDSNYIFLQEVQRLVKDINQKWEEVRMKRNI